MEESSHKQDQITTSKKNELQAKLHGYIKSHATKKKYKRPFYYHLDEADVRLFLFDKNDYSVDVFGKCMTNNLPKDDSDHNFFGKLMEGLIFDSDLNIVTIDFIEKYKMAQYYQETTSASEKVFISRVYDDRQIEVAIRETVSKMEEIERVSVTALLCMFVYVLPHTFTILWLFTLFSLFHYFLFSYTYSLNMNAFMHTCIYTCSWKRYPPTI